MILLFNLQSACILKGKKRFLILSHNFHSLASHLFFNSFQYIFHSYHFTETFLVKSSVTTIWLNLYFCFYSNLSQQLSTSLTPLFLNQSSLDSAITHSSGFSCSFSVSFVRSFFYYSALKSQSSSDHGSGPFSLSFFFLSIYKS